MSSLFFPPSGSGYSDARHRCRTSKSLERHGERIGRIDLPIGPLASKAGRLEDRGSPPTGNVGGFFCAKTYYVSKTWQVLKHLIVRLGRIGHHSVDLGQFIFGQVSPLASRNVKLDVHDADALQVHNAVA